MQDSTITYKVTTVGIAEAEAQFNALGATIKNVTVNQNGSVTASGNLSKAQAEQAVATANAAKTTDRASKSQSNYFAHIAKTTVQSALVNKAFLGLVSSAGDAVKQVDLFSNFPASMAALGLSSKDASESLLTLRDYSAQAGISLTEATQSVARFSEITKNVKAATAEFIGVKNALIAGGAQAEVQSNALEQLTQAYSRGKPQLIEWRSLMVAMPAQLSQVAKAMNLPNAQALGEALTSGKVSMQDFLTELTKLSTGTGPIAQQALARMQGIQFAANVMKNALTNGLAAIYQAVGKQNIIGFFQFLTQVIIVLTHWAVDLVNILISLFNIVSKVFGGPQIAHFNANAQGASNALDSGANSAGDMADGLGNAADNAKKINKSLASFDKMNVLPDKTSADTGGGGGGGTGLSPADASALDGIFGDIGSKLQAISGWAKVFAGILAGIAGIKFLKGLLGELNDTVNTFKEAKKNAEAFGKTMKDIGNTTADAFKKGSPFVKQAGTAGTEAGTAIISGIASVIGAAAGNIWKFLFAPLIGAAATALEFVGTLFLLTFLGAAEVVALPAEAVIAVGALIVAAIVAIGYVIYRNWDTIWKAMKKVVEVTWQAIQKIWDGITGFFVGIWEGMKKGFDAVWGGIKAGFQAVIDFVKSHATIFEIIFSPVIFAVAAVILVVTGLVAFFKFIFDSIVSIFTAAPGFFGGIFQAAWDGIVAVWNVVVAFFKAIWDGIVAIFTVVATFFGTVFKAAWDAIVAVWTVVSGWFHDFVIQPLINLFTPIVQFYIKIFTDAWNGIKAVWNVVAGFFSGIWNNIKGAFGDVAGWFAGVFRDAYNRVTGVFSSLWTWFRDNVWNRIVSVFTTVGTTVGNAISGAFKGVVNGVLKGIGGIWNGFVDLLNGAINVVNKLPGVNLPKVARWTVPQLAQGAVIDQPTLAMVGEAGKEAVVPLENNTEWIDTLASKINKAQNNGQPVQLVVQIGEDKIATKVIELINEKTIMSGKNAIYV